MPRHHELHLAVIRDGGLVPHPSLQEFRYKEQACDEARDLILDGEEAEVHVRLGDRTIVHYVADGQDEPRKYTPDQEFYFAYGMLISPQTMSRMAPYAEAVGPARLPDHRLEFSGAATVVPSVGDSVYGMLWRNVDWGRLDGLEGFPCNYTRTRSPVVLLEDGREFMCEHYEMHDAPLRSPSPGYFGDIERQHHLFGMPTEGLYEALERSRSARPSRGW